MIENTLQGPVTVFRGGAVFTADSTLPWATAVAVYGDRIVAVGSDDAVAPYLAQAADVVELDGRLLVPGFVDSHVHPVMGGLERLRCDLSGLANYAEYRDAIATYAADNANEPWVLGGGWSIDAFDAGLPSRHQLDEAEHRRPAYFPNRDHHSGWANSAALSLAGIDRHTPDPTNGRIERDQQGDPTGLLHEGAMDLVESIIPSPPPLLVDAALREAQGILHAQGITGWQDAMVRFDGTHGSVHDAYMRGQSQGWLTARVQGALWWPRGIDVTDVADLVRDFAARRAEAANSPGRYNADFVKIMQDGVLETCTAALIDPYLDTCGCRTFNRGMSFFSREVLEHSVVELDNAGFHVHFHALGDGAVRDVLDAIAATREHNPTADTRHHLAHLQLINEEDVRRFRQLRVGATIQPLWARHEAQVDRFASPVIGAGRAARQYPFGDLRREGSMIAMGSDWPVSSASPMRGIHVAVTRRAHGAPDHVTALGTAQELSLSESLTAYTAGSARVNGWERAVGVISSGAYADLALLDRNPFELPADEIAETQVQRTYVGGEVVYGTE
ncbi:amidohydrolase [Mycolicibacterium sp. YH-1]|uniref:amidohydrolase n=1 Tax=Mycolicibacterium sp. YH-1 TaxID=2908837 RepID=UPI001F4BF078|nr:amidohydrolase [Mycolicibacterium sp. YH-1]UNB52924.1 amidohydrolase [Mycolicibacterium sp. YH-1]